MEEKQGVGKAESTPPYTQAVLRVGPVAANSRSTCLASSRVGASTMHPGDLGLLGRAMSFSTTGRAKAKVLPDPVRARPIRSRPADIMDLV